MKTIEIGIDLGTTNSEVAINTGGEIRIVKTSSQINHTCIQEML